MFIVALGAVWNFIVPHGRVLTACWPASEISSSFQSFISTEIFPVWSGNILFLYPQYSIKTVSQPVFLKIIAARLLLILLVSSS